ncbi:lipoate--protein ligase, partial [Streptococcus danieliae]|nr:lipoate--protein ligase [Streptococcus danieliae]
DAYVNVVDSRIDNLKIYGDFFGIEDVAAVEEALIGLAYERDVVLAKLKELDLSRYFAGISAQEIAEAIVE